MSQHLYIALWGCALSSGESSGIECSITIAEMYVITFTMPCGNTVRLDVDSMQGDMLHKYQVRKLSLLHDVSNCFSFLKMYFVLWMALTHRKKKGILSHSCVNFY